MTEQKVDPLLRKEFLAHGTNVLGEKRIAVVAGRFQHEKGREFRYIQGGVLLLTETNSDLRFSMVNFDDPNHVMWSMILEKGFRMRRIDKYIAFKGECGNLLGFYFRKQDRVPRGLFMDRVRNLCQDKYTTFFGRIWRYFRPTSSSEERKRQAKHKFVSVSKEDVMKDNEWKNFLTNKMGLSDHEIDSSEVSGALNLAMSNSVFVMMKEAAKQQTGLIGMAMNFFFPDEDEETVDNSSDEKKKTMGLEDDQDDNLLTEVTKKKKKEEEEAKRKIEELTRRLQALTEKQENMELQIKMKEVKEEVEGEDDDDDDESEEEEEEEIIVDTQLPKEEEVKEVEVVQFDAEIPPPPENDPPPLPDDFIQENKREEEEEVLVSEHDEDVSVVSVSKQEKKKKRKGISDEWKNKIRNRVKGEDSSDEEEEEGEEEEKKGMMIVQEEETQEEEEEEEIQEQPKVGGLNDLLAQIRNFRANNKLKKTKTVKRKVEKAVSQEAKWIIDMYKKKKEEEERKRKEEEKRRKEEGLDVEEFGVDDVANDDDDEGWGDNDDEYDWCIDEKPKKMVECDLKAKIDFMEGIVVFHEKEAEKANLAAEVVK